MAVWFGDGFDLYTALADCGTHWDGSFGGTVSLALSPAGRFTGSRSLVGASASTTPYITKTSGSNDAVHHICVAFQQTSALTGTNKGIYFTLYDGSTAQCTVVLQSDGSIILTAGIVSGAALSTYSGAVAAINTWYHFEIEVVINNTTGSFKVRKNGNVTEDHTATSLDTQASANAYANKIAAGNNWSSGTGHNIDDFLWRSDTSVSWIGDVRCYTRMPAADSSVQWTASGAVAPVTPVAHNSSMSGINANNARYHAFTASYTGTVSTVSMIVSAAITANVKAAIYASSSTAPTTVLATSDVVVNPGIGIVTFTFSSPPSVTRGTQYWFAVCQSATSGSYYYNSAPPSTYPSSSYGALSISYASFPTANPTLAVSFAWQFTVNITSGTGTNAPMVCDLMMDGAASYVYSSTNGHSDLYAISSIANTPATTHAVVTRGYFQKTDAGTRNATVQLKSSSTTVQGTSTALPAGSWVWISRTDQTDPATGAAWTATGVNNALIGPIVTA